MKKSKKETEKKINNKTQTAAEKRPWKETLYNCPFLLLLAATAMAAMVCSDDIGVNIITSGGRNAVKAVVATEVVDTVEAAENETSGSLITSDIEKTDEQDVQESDDGVNTSADEENIGEALEMKAGEKTDEPGITRFEYYDPKPIDSVYYSDAGKVAMTTEYDYTIENISYFNDAAFLGDSRTLGISDYAGLEGADFYCDSGMTIFKLLGEDGVTYQKTGKKVDLNQVLQQNQYGKIYIMLGMNELGYGNTQMYLKQYGEVVAQIREWQPDAIIYIMANLHVSEKKNNPETEFNNININDKNAASALLANGTDIFYLDCNPLFTDENGFLNADLTFDGVHLYAQHYDVWRQFLLEHCVEGRKSQDAEGIVQDTGEMLQQIEETMQKTENIAQDTEDIVQGRKKTVQNTERIM